MVRRQIHLTEQQDRGLKALAARTGSNQSELIRRAVDELLAAEGARDWKTALKRARPVDGAARGRGRAGGGAAGVRRARPAAMTALLRDSWVLIDYLRGHPEAVAYLEGLDRKAPIRRSLHTTPRPWLPSRSPPV